jgi:serine/threonine-protein kinase
MGEVYRAKDTTLGRDVAIKVLPASVAGDAERLARFEREAKLLASLSHANIATLHALERHDSRHVLVMELAPGEDLTVRIARGPMPLDEALPTAIQICCALEAAHDKGVVHRDLKPANIKVSDDGAVKVLDFGLAKALGPEDGGESSNAMNSPTLTAQATAAGIILGTAAYMSPEQARGRPVDKRADVWAFGAILFEMLTGSRLFQGETISDTLAAVLRQDVPWSSLPADTPAELKRLLRRVLERDRKNRLRDIADARLVLEEVARGGSDDTAAPAIAPSPGRPNWLIVAGAAVLLVALGALAGRALWPASTVASLSGPVRLVVPLPPGVTRINSPAVSPDGRFVVFVGQSGSAATKLYLHHFDQAMPRALEGTDGGARPFVSPDGRWIGFRRTSRMERILVDGGQPIFIADAVADAPGSTWLPDGRIVFAVSWLRGLTVVSQEGGEVRNLTTLNAARNEIGHWFPTALPGGRQILFTVWLKATGLDDAEVALLDVGTGQYRILFKGAEARYVSPGAIVYFRGGAYHAVRFDLASQTVTGDPVRVLEDARGNIPEGGYPQTDIAAPGTAAYVTTPFTPDSRLVWVSQGGKLEELPFPVRKYGALSLTRDGSRAAVDVLEAGRYSIRLLDLVKPGEDILEAPGTNWGPVWNADGTRVAFISIRKGDFDAYWKDVTSTAAAEPLLATDADDIPEAFSPDGTTLIGQQSVADGTYPLFRMTLNPPGKPEALTPFNGESAVISPNGKFIAFTSDRSDSDEAYILPIDGRGTAERVSNRGADAVSWSTDGRELYYARPPEIIAVSLAMEGPRLRPMGERVWARVESWPGGGAFALGQDGRMLIRLPKEPVKPEIRVILGWDKEIARKLGLQ